MKISRLLFSYSGRSNRAPFWLGLILSLVLPFIIFAIFGALDILAITQQNEDFNSPTAKAIATLIILFWMIITLTALAAKRFHDLNFAGWLGIFMLIPYLNFLLILYLGTAKGTNGPNKYGPDILTTTITGEQNGHR